MMNASVSSPCTPVMPSTKIRSSVNDVTMMAASNIYTVTTHNADMSAVPTITIK